MVHEIVPFFTKIYSFNLTEFNVNEIIQHIENIQVLDSGTIVSNRGGWQSHPIFSASDVMLPVINQITSVLNPIYDSMGILSEPNLLGYWMNINRKHSTNNSHCHPGCYYSAVLYVKVPENSGNIVFERGDLLPHYLGDIKITENNYIDYWFKPAVGEVIIFPAWINHYVEQNLTNEHDDRRISIAFNYR